MAFFKKKADPISERSKELNEQISALEAQIKQLSTKVEHAKSHPRVRSTAMPQGQKLTREPAAPSTAPVFEKVDYQKLKEEEAADTTAAHFNDLGVRKYDLFGAVKRLTNHFRAPAAGNPKLVTYLAAGSIKGLRPLRYEKRVARNRFIFLSMFFVLILWGLLYAIFGQN